MLAQLISPQTIEAYFLEIERQLHLPEARCPFQFNKCCIETRQGVYCYFVDDGLKYVGETGCIAKRINDARYTLNHTLRRSLGERYFSSHPEYAKATSTSAFHPDIEKQLDDWMLAHLKVAFLHIPIGRKEFEEWLQAKHPRVEMLNKRGKRT